MDKPVHLGYTKIELSKLFMSNTQYDGSQLYFGQKNVQIQHMVTDSFILSVNTHDITNRSKNPKDLSDSIISNEKHLLFFNGNKKTFW